MMTGRRRISDDLSPLQDERRHGIGLARRTSYFGLPQTPAPLREGRQGAKYAASLRGNDMVPFGLSGGTGSAWRLRAGRCGLSDYGDLCQVIVHIRSPDIFGFTGHS